MLDGLWYDLRTSGTCGDPFVRSLIQMRHCFGVQSVWVGNGKRDISVGAVASLPVVLLVLKLVMA